MLITAPILAVLVSSMLAAGPVETGASTTVRAYGPGYGGAIPDNDAIGFLSPVVVPDSFPIETIEIRLIGLQHNYCADLTIELRHAGVSAPAVLCTNIRFGNSADFNGDYVFSDSGADLWATANGLSGPDDLPPGPYMASAVGGATYSLNARFLGEDARGPWTLRIADTSFLVSGAIEGWELILGGAPVCAAGAPADVNGDGVVNAEDLALVLGSWGACPQ